jgi:hypothetical protein
LAGLFTDWLCKGTVIGKLLRQLMLKVTEEDKRLQFQRLLPFVPVIGSRELEGKAAKVSVGFGDDQCNIPDETRTMGVCCYGDQYAEISRGFT